ncbi:predicted protein [Lichtheimia corymbifera JMRC:FSU:9682]|uniref:Uncharacterized protein n=2 Tax=Lichtheimia corymbifera JMRC:FSU:9682 TaxID=1263082 RepID=A0A068RM84_9FUNG|nr:predicted protein [Lichtheimia corymbifera JMRC:FSU:9682]
MIAALKRKPSLPITLTGGGNKQSSDDQSTTTSLSSKLKSSLALFGSHLNVQDNNTRRFANDEAFERYHYRKQSLSNMTLDLKREPRGRRPSEGNNNAATKGILVNSTSHKRPGHHRHTHSLFQQPTQNAPSPGRKTHRRSKTAITMRPSIGVHSSGELTAKEFADMAGIKILPNDELLLVPTTTSTCTTPLLSSSLVSTTSSNIDSSSRVLNDELVLVDKRGGGASSATTSSGSSQLPQQQSSHCSCCNCSSAISVSSMDEPVTPTTLSAATPQQPQQDTITTTDYHKKTTTTTGDTKSDNDNQQQPHIWEDAFWRDPRKDHHEPPPIIHEMRTHNTIVIKRGRFEIHLEPSTATTHVP